MKKPDAEIFLTVANALHTKPEQCVFIDDVRENIASARSLNFKTIHFQDANQLRQELTEMGIAM
jgi:HAD superfamily hydrolase (TIGR01509 family)